MKKGYFALAIATILIFVALFTNPNLARQKEIVKEEIKLYIDKDLLKTEINDADGIFANLGATVGRALGGFIIDPIVESMLSSDNYVLFSTTKIIWEGEPEIIGIAAFNNIFFFKNIEDLMNEVQLRNKY